MLGDFLKYPFKRGAANVCEIFNGQLGEGWPMFSDFLNGPLGEGQLTLVVFQIPFRRGAAYIIRFFK